MAGLPQKTWQVDGITYRTTLLSAVEGRGLYLRLVKAIAPALDSLAHLKTGDPEAVMLEALGKILGSLEGALFEDLCTAMCEYTVCPRTGGEDSLKADFGGVHFAGKYNRLLKCVVEFVKANGMLDFLHEISAAGLTGERTKSE